MGSSDFPRNRAPLSMPLRVPREALQEGAVFEVGYTDGALDRPSRGKRAVVVRVVEAPADTSWGVRAGDLWAFVSWIEDDRMFSEQANIQVRSACIPAAWLDPVGTLADEVSLPRDNATWDLLRRLYADADCGIDLAARVNEAADLWGISRRVVWACLQAEGVDGLA